MDRNEALKLLKKGAEGVAEWNHRRKLNEAIPDLSGANLRGADLSGAKFSRANLIDASLIDADLHRADLSRANLSGANLRRANLSRAVLRAADLSAADLSTTELSSADLSGAKCWFTVFANVDLSDVKGLETIQHIRPSTIGTDTLFRSKGKIPEAFLQGCGLPEALIQDLPSIFKAMKPIQYYSCFISYSSKNRDFAERLHADLQAKGVRCWFDQKDLEIGGKIRPSIAEAIRAHDKLMLVLSKHSIASDWVEGEVEAALERERQEKRTVVFPIRLDEVVLETSIAWASQIRLTHHVGDFRDWESQDAYQKAFERLLRALRASERAVPDSGAPSPSGDG